MFIVVTGHGKPEPIDAYLYNHATRFATTTTHDGVADRFVALVRTANDRYLTDYQAGRLGSGLYGAKVIEKFDDAVAAFRDAQDYDLKFHKPIDADL